MMLPRRAKIAIGAASGGIIAFLIGLVFYANVESEEINPKVSIELTSVNFSSLDQETNTMKISVNFIITNEYNRALTISNMEYELFANGRSLGTGFVSYEDIPLVGRPQLFESGTIIPSEFSLKYSEDVKDVWDALLSSSPISWYVKGKATIESAVSIVDKTFESSL